MAWKSFENNQASNKNSFDDVREGEGIWSIKTDKSPVIHTFISSVTLPYSDTVVANTQFQMKSNKKRENRLFLKRDRSNLATTFQSI